MVVHIMHNNGEISLTPYLLFIFAQSSNKQHKQLLIIANAAGDHEGANNLNVKRSFKCMKQFAALNREQLSKKVNVHKSTEATWLSAF